MPRPMARPRNVSCIILPALSTTRTQARGQALDMLDGITAADDDNMGARMEGSSVPVPRRWVVF